MDQTSVLIKRRLEACVAATCAVMAIPPYAMVHGADRRAFRAKAAVAYAARAEFAIPWPLIADALGYEVSQSCLNNARRIALKEGLNWPPAWSARPAGVAEIAAAEPQRAVVDRPAPPAVDDSPARRSLGEGGASSTPPRLAPRPTESSRIGAAPVAERKPAPLPGQGSTVMNFNPPRALERPSPGPVVMTALETRILRELEIRPLSVPSLATILDVKEIVLPPLMRALAHQGEITADEPDDRGERWRLWRVAK